MATLDGMLETMNSNLPAVIGSKDIIPFDSGGALVALNKYSLGLKMVSTQVTYMLTRMQNVNNYTINFNKNLEETEKKANKLSESIKKFVKNMLSLSKIKKGMSFVDEYVNLGVKLNAVNNGLMEQSELQSKVFAAANHSRSAYSDMVGAVSQMGPALEKSFGNNVDEMLAFTELVQMSSKLAGASQSEQSDVMSSISKAMSSGKLDESGFTSIMKSAPKIADAIVEYTGKSINELQKLSSEGYITADILKNAMFKAGGDIESEFSDMPMTFADVWNKIKNGGIQAFGSVMEKISKLLANEKFQQFINGIIVGFEFAAQAVEWLIDVISNNLDTIIPLLGIVGSVAILYVIKSLWSMIPPLKKIKAAWNTTFGPMFWIVVIIAIIISALRQLGVSWEQIFGFIGGVIGVFAGVFYNIFAFLWNIVADFINFFGNAFKNPVASIKILFLDLAVRVIGIVEEIVKGIVALINKIPGVEINISDKLTEIKNDLAEKSAEIKSESEWIEYVKAKEFVSFEDAAIKGSSIGVDLYSNMSDVFGGLTDGLTENSGMFDFSQFGTQNNPLVVEGTEPNGELNVNMSDDDLKSLREIAERDFINQFTTATLAPTITVTFGDVHETADAEKVAGRIQKILEEEIAMAAEGAYA